MKLTLLFFPLGQQQRASSNDMSLWNNKSTYSYQNSDQVDHSDSQIQILRHNANVISCNDCLASNKRPVRCSTAGLKKPPQNKAERIIHRKTLFYTIVNKIKKVLRKNLYILIAIHFMRQLYIIVKNLGARIIVLSRGLIPMVMLNDRLLFPILDLWGRF